MHTLCAIVAEECTKDEALDIADKLVESFYDYYEADKDAVVPWYEDRVSTLETNWIESQIHDPKDMEAALDMCSHIAWGFTYVHDTVSYRNGKAYHYIPSSDFNIIKNDLVDMFRDHPDWNINILIVNVHT